MNDEALDKAVWHILAEQMTHIINCEDPKHRKAMSCVAFTAGAHVEMMQLILQDRERAVLEGKIDLISWSLSRTSMSELKQRWKELEDELAELSNPTQEKEGEMKLQPISLEDAIKAMGYLFRDLSYHSDGRWIARSGANTGRFMTSARTPRQAVFKLAEKIEQERQKLVKQAKQEL